MQRVSTSSVTQCGSGPWKITFNTYRYFKCGLDGTNSVGEMCTDDINGFESLEAALELVKAYGWRYTIEKPHARRHTRKSYALNFVYKKARE